MAIPCGKRVEGGVLVLLGQPRSSFIKKGGVYILVHDSFMVTVSSTLDVIWKGFAI